jgi:hypothetical protein
MKTQSSKYIYTIFFVFFEVVVFGQVDPTPPPPPGIAIDDDKWGFFILALIFGIYIIYKYRSKRKPAA